MSAAPPFFTRYGLSRTGEREAPLVLEPYAHVCRRGALRLAVIASAVDIAGSLFARELAGGDPTFTADLSVRAPARGAPARIVARASLLRAGRGAIATAVALEADGAPFAYGETTFTRMPPREGAGPPREGLPLAIPRHPLERPLADEVGIEAVDPARGRVAVALRDALRNSEGALQGALVALLAEVAAETFADRALGAPQVATELDLRYLAPAKVGPIATEARWVRAPEDGMLRVALRDLGHAERLTASALLRVRAADADAPPPTGGAAIR